MPHLADTNILLRFFRTADPQHGLVRAAVTLLLNRGVTLVYAHQSRREFWNVCTRPVPVNGFGMSVAQTVAAMQLIDTTFARLPDMAAAGPEWDRLVTQYRVVGRGVHDAQLVASMLVHGITNILTLNDADLARYSGEITVVHPRQV